jgi:aminopeptidase-like protein
VNDAGTAGLAREIEAYFDRLWPLMRSITGAGVRQSHDILSEIVPLERIEVPSGTPVFDWIVPKEWVVREAYVVMPDGRRILDIRVNNLHLINYSIPFRGKVSRAELDRHLHSIPELPTAIPYITSYYALRWGFCIADAERRRLPEGDYEVVIDTDFIDGSLTISHTVLPGESEREVLLSTYTCHPSLANNELSGPLVMAFLARAIAAWPRRRYSYRFVFLPETIGSISYLAHIGEHLKAKCDAGFVVSCVGNATPFHYKRSRRGNALGDRAAEYVLRRRGTPAENIMNFFVTRGGDELQYCSLGFDLPVGSMTRLMYGLYLEYHTSLDNRDFISFAALAEAVHVYLQTCRAIEVNRRYRTTLVHGMPQLGKRGLYPTLSNARNADEHIAAITSLIAFSDGATDLLEIAGRHGLDIELLDEIAQRCVAAGLLEAVG